MKSSVISAEQLALIPKLYDAAICDEKWDGALNTFVDCVGATSVALFAFEHDFKSFGLAKAGGTLQNQQRTADEYSKKFRAYEDEAMAFFAKSRPLTIFKDVDVWPDLEVLKHREDFQFMRDWANVFRRVGARLNGNSAWFDGCIVHYRADLEEIPPGGQALISGLLPSLAKVVELNRFFFILQSKYQAVLAVLDRVKIGVCIADARGRIAVANAEADRIFELHDGLARMRDDRLKCSRDDDTNAVKEAVEAACQTAVGQDARNETLFAIDRRSGERPFLLEVVPLRDALQEIDTAFAGAMITIIDPENPRPFSTENVAKLYGLTAAEGDVCRLLVEGMTNEGIAEARNVSTDTIKNQVKSIYRKLGVAGRADLVREVLTVNPPID